jgi:hypothetical protein
MALFMCNTMDEFPFGSLPFTMIPIALNKILKCPEWSHRMLSPANARKSRGTCSHASSRKARHNSWAQRLE